MCEMRETNVTNIKNKKKHIHTTTFTLAAKMEMMATAILCMFWSSWLQSHCITSLAASNLTISRGLTETLLACHPFVPLL